MTLHPDILTDLITIYHAGEASQASQALLEQEAARDPKVAAALAAPPRAIPLLPDRLGYDERKVLRRVRTRYQAMSFGIVWTLALVAVAFLPRFLKTSAGTAIATNALPFIILLLFFGGAVSVLYFIRRTR